MVPAQPLPRKDPERASSAGDGAGRASSRGTGADVLSGMAVCGSAWALGFEVAR